MDERIKVLEEHVAYLTKNQAQMVAQQTALELVLDQLVGDLEELLEAIEGSDDEMVEIVGPDRGHDIN